NAVNKPPKSMTSVARKTHMPSSAVSRSAISAFRVVIRRSAHDRLFEEVVTRRRRRRLPLQTARVPRIGTGHSPPPQRREQVHQRQHVANGKNGCPSRRQHIQYLELRGIRVVPPRHPQVAQDVLRKER